MIKDVHINNPQPTSWRDRIPSRCDSFAQSFRHYGYFEGGCGWKNSEDCHRARRLAIASFIIHYLPWQARR